MFDDIIMPGRYGVGTEGFVPTEERYKDVMRRIVELDDGGYSVDLSDESVKRTMSLCGASTIDDIRRQLRGW